MESHIFESLRVGDFVTLKMSSEITSLCSHRNENDDDYFDDTLLEFCGKTFRVKYLYESHVMLDLDEPFFVEVWRGKMYSHKDFLSDTVLRREDVPGKKPLYLQLNLLKEKTNCIVEELTRPLIKLCKETLLEEDIDMNNDYVLTNDEVNEGLGVIDEGDNNLRREFDKGDIIEHIKVAKAFHEETTGSSQENDFGNDYKYVLKVNDSRWIESCQDYTVKITTNITHALVVPNEVIANELRESINRDTGISCEVSPIMTMIKEIGSDKSDHDVLRCYIDTEERRIRELLETDTYLDDHEKGYQQGVLFGLKRACAVLTKK